jgi:hypothetical protein
VTGSHSSLKCQLVSFNDTSFVQAYGMPGLRKWTSPGMGVDKQVSSEWW